MEKNEMKEMSVPYIVYESTIARNERTIKRIIIALIITIIAFVATNAFWIYEITNYEYVIEGEDVSVISEENGNANYIGNDGDISNGNG